MEHSLVSGLIVAPTALGIDEVLSLPCVKAGAAVVMLRLSHGGLSAAAGARPAGEVLELPLDTADADAVLAALSGFHALMNRARKKEGVLVAMVSGAGASARLTLVCLFVVCSYLVKRRGLTPTQALTLARKRSEGSFLAVDTAPLQTLLEAWKNAGCSYSAAGLPCQVLAPSSRSPRDGRVSPIPVVVDVKTRQQRRGSTHPRESLSEIAEFGSLPGAEASPAALRESPVSSSPSAERAQLTGSATKEDTQEDADIRPQPLQNSAGDHRAHDDSTGPAEARPARTRNSVMLDTSSKEDVSPRLQPPAATTTSATAAAAAAAVGGDTHLVPPHSPARECASSPSLRIIGVATDDSGDGQEDTDLLRSSHDAIRQVSASPTRSGSLTASLPTIAPVPVRPAEPAAVLRVAEPAKTPLARSEPKTRPPTLSRNKSGGVEDRAASAGPAEGATLRRTNSKPGLFARVANKLGRRKDDTEEGSSHSPAPHSPATLRPMSSPKLHETGNATPGSPATLRPPPSSKLHDAAGSAYDSTGVRKRREMVDVTVLADLPGDDLKKVQEAGIVEADVTSRDDLFCLLNVLHFHTKRVYRFAPGPDEPSERVRVTQGDRNETDDFDYATAEVELLDHEDPRKLWKLSHETGKGGFGSVFEATALKNRKGPKVACKVLPHERSKNRRYNLEEIRFLKQFSHPNIVRFFGAYKVMQKRECEIWVVMELMRGGTLTEAVRAHQFSENQIAYIALEMLHGIRYLHRSNLAHRDLKSANVMLTVDGQVKLIDFGLCCDMSNGLQNHMVGSPFWMPPEMIRREPHGLPVDVWSFGICVLELANNVIPHRHSTIYAMYVATTRGFPKPFDSPSTWTPLFHDFIAKALVVDPAKRATSKELRDHDFTKTATSSRSMQKIISKIFVNDALDLLNLG